MVQQGKQIDSVTDRQTDRQTETDRQRQTDRQTDRDSDRDGQNQRQRGSGQTGYSDGVRLQQIGYCMTNEYTQIGTLKYLGLEH